MVLAEPRSRVAVFLQDCADSGAVLVNDRVVTRETRGHFGDDAKARRMMVSPGDERRPRRRAERGGVELRVAQSRLRERSMAGVGMTPPKVPETPYPWSSVMISSTLGAPFGRHDASAASTGLESVAIFFNHAAERQRWWRDLFPVNRCGRAR